MLKYDDITSVERKKKGGKKGKDSRHGRRESRIEKFGR